MQMKLMPCCLGVCMGGLMLIRMQQCLQEYLHGHAVLRDASICCEHAYPEQMT